MSGPSGRFDPSELRVPGEAAPSPADQADAMLAARELEALAAGSAIRPTEGFEDRVMAVIATEPVPKLVVRPGSAVRGGIAASFLLTVRDAWRVATSGGRPMAVRAQALALVLLVVVAATAVAGAGAVGVGSLLDRRSPAPSVQPGPSEAPTQPEPSPSTGPTESDGTGPSESPGSTESAEPTETDGAETPRPARTPRATETPEPGKTPKPGETPKASDDHSGSGGGSGG